MPRSIARKVLNASAALLLCAATAAPLSAQRGGAGGGSATPLPSIADKTAGMEMLDGLLPLYWDADQGNLWMEIPEMGQELIHFMGFGAGLGSNDIGLDRGALRGSQIVVFERVGRKVMMVQPNYRYRALSDNESEVKAVRDAFARSVLWGFTAAAETGDRVLVDVTPYIVRDAVGAAARLSPGTYRLDVGRSSVYMDMTKSFPTNTEMEAELTFVSQAAGGRGGFGGGRGAFEGVGSVASTGSAASIRVHYSFVEAPDDGYEPRQFDPRSSFGANSFQDYAVPLGEDMTQRWIRRHRLEKRNPNAARSEAVEPIVYYLDPGAPEPIRSALLEGGRWWNQAFEAAGYDNAFQVRIRPDSISSLDARYNVINWVHRSTRGWSTGGSVTDPRTGEIIKGVVTLGSLRWRQDYMMAEGLLSPYANGDERPDDLEEWALARIRQLSAHEIGHTIGIAHQYYNSSRGRISVMDYPHPLIELNSDGSFDYSNVYDDKIGEWDKVAIRFGYSDFPDGTDEAAALDEILDDAWEQDLRYMSNQDVATTPQADQWANGTDMGMELDRMLDVRAAALARFGEGAIRNGRPMATIEEALVPLYMHHRYQVESTATTLGGVGYTYARRGDGLPPVWRIPAEDQNRALDALMRSISPSELALPRSVIEAIPPRPPGWGRTRELFPRYTGGGFDAITPAVVAAAHTVNNVLRPDRAARLIEQNMMDSNLPGLTDVLDRVIAASFGASASSAYERQIKIAVEGVVLDRMKFMAATAPMMEVRAAASAALERIHAQVADHAADEPHAALMARDIQRFMERPHEPATSPTAVNAPPGAPIGQAPMEWLGGSYTSEIGQAAMEWLALTEAWCPWDEVH